MNLCFIAVNKKRYHFGTFGDKKRGTGTFRFLFFCVFWKSGGRIVESSVILRAEESKSGSKKGGIGG